MDCGNNRPKVVLLTGEIGSGKSTVRKMFEKKGVPATDADGIAREIQVPGSPCLTELEIVFPGCLTPDGELNRAFIRDIIAKNPEANVWLKEIMTPHVMSVLEEWTMQQAGAMYVIWESALIPYGTPGIDRFCIVSSNTGDQVARITKRNPDWSLDQILGIIKQQRTTIYRCNDVINNAGSLDDLKWEVDHLHEGYDRLWEKKNESSIDVDG